MTKTITQFNMQKVQSYKSIWGHSILGNYISLAHTLILLYNMISAKHLFIYLIFIPKSSY